MTKLPEDKTQKRFCIQKISFSCLKSTFNILIHGKGSFLFLILTFNILIHDKHLLPLTHTLQCLVLNNTPSLLGITRTMCISI